MDIDSNNHLHLAYQGFDVVDTEVYYTVTGGAVPVELVKLDVYNRKGEHVDNIVDELQKAGHVKRPKSTWRPGGEWGVSRSTENRKGN